MRDYGKIVSVILDRKNREGDQGWRTRGRCCRYVSDVSPHSNMIGLYYLPMMYSGA